MPELPPPPSYGKIDGQLVQQMLTTPPDQDAPFYAVNLMKYRERAAYADGRETTLSGREADDEYFPVEVLTKIGAEVVFVADVEKQLAGDDVEWDRIAIVRYPSRRSMIEMNMREDFQKQHAHKDAGMQQTIVMLCEGEAPEPPGLRSREALLRLGDDSTRVVMQVARFAVAREAAPASSGIRPELNFAVAGTIVGDGRAWSHVRMTRFADAADWQSGSTEAPWKEAEQAFAGASAERYSMLLRPRFDWWAGSGR